MPALVRRVGESQSGRISYPAVDAYLARHHLPFDRALLGAMFEEADHRREGSLAPRDVIATVTGARARRRGVQLCGCLLNCCTPL